MKIEPYKLFKTRCQNGYFHIYKYLFAFILKIRYFNWSFVNIASVVLVRRHIVSGLKWQVSCWGLYAVCVRDIWFYLFNNAGTLWNIDLSIYFSNIITRDRSYVGQRSTDHAEGFNLCMLATGAEMFRTRMHETPLYPSGRNVCLLLALIRYNKEYMFTSCVNQI